MHRWLACLGVAYASNSTGVCEDTPGWTNGYAACNNYVPVDPDCHKDGVVCHFYKAHPSFCVKGMKDPWRHCCTCGGGSTFDGHAPTEPPPPKVKMPSMLDWLPGVHKMEKEMGEMKATLDKKLKPLEQGVSEVYAGLRQPDFDAPPELEGNSMAEVNLVVFFIILLMTIVTSLGYLWETAHPEAKVSRARPWASLMLVASYALLIPGLTQVIFSFNIVVNVLGHRIDVQPEKGHAVACTETITGLVNLLWRTGSRTGAVLIVLYAVVVPILKLLLLLVGEVLRFSTARGAVLISRSCIMLVQTVSKWACPDIFAYILLVHLVRLLNHNPLILTAAKLDVGFSCFSVFCVCSTISSLGIQLPEVPGGSRSRCFVSSLPAVAAVLAFSFVVLFVTGLLLPCMALRIDERQLYPPNGSVPYSAKPLVESLAIPELLRTDISIFSCSLWLIKEIGGEANSFFSMIMFGVCVIVLTLTDVLLLLMAALRVGQQRSCPFYYWAKICRKLAMLDVAIMGVYVITFCMGIYKKQGIVVSTRQGLPVLIMAEVLHTAMYWIVSGEVEAQEAQMEQKLYDQLAMASGGDEEGPSSPKRFNLYCCTMAQLLPQQAWKFSLKGAEEAS